MKMVTGQQALVYVNVVVPLFASVYNTDTRLQHCGESKGYLSASHSK